MKIIFLNLLLFNLFSCNIHSNNEKENSEGRLLPTYDTIKYNTKIIPDTTGCWWITQGRSIMDTLFFEKAFVISFSDTFLATSKHRRLWTCNIPVHIMNPGDTVLISGFVHQLYSSDAGRGFPTRLTSIVYSNDLR